MHYPTKADLRRAFPEERSEQARFINGLRVSVHKQTQANRKRRFRRHLHLMIERHNEHFTEVYIKRQAVAC